MLVALVVIMLAVIYGYPRYTNYMQEMEWGVEASNMTAVGSAAKSYIRDNRDALVSQVSGGTPVTVTGADLQLAGYLPTGFSLRNTAEQTYLVGIARDPKFNQKLVAFVLTSGGQEIAYKGLRYISQKVDGSGGYVWPDNVATGAFAGWELNLNSYGLNAAKGRLATWLSSDVLGTDLQESDRLYRYQVNGRPDLNRMHTAIDMGSNDLNNAKAVNGETGSFSNTVTAENDIKSKSGWLITGTGKGWLNEAHGGGLYMDDNDWIKSVNGKGISTTGQLKGGTVRSDGRLSTGEYLQLDGVATAGAACENRTVGLESTGALLSCQGGIWQNLSGGTFSRVGSEKLVIASPGNYRNILVTISSLFNSRDGSHTAYADYTLTVNGNAVGRLRNQVVVSKGGSSGHKWLYQSHAITQRMFSVPVSTGNQITVTRGASALYVSGDIRIDLTD
ncbi:shufflon system plasmid conjugative transfer pilus tip adhesin PilV (plasmid) [Erwinia tracheiphila]|uniref:Shufflon system plasmid conjugative transfer pilus tip adhesin PilV n=1 Tax=Erwinia tracheiphila TaxID=65700 RepID=A0A345D000_9GAMM|nr:shufflon system plasmid conjugative transfer pilus tip adhesin PilV [Erwinia tracheiphila]AXF79017.1 shufflon system plasmid conjugative transfer pilus tip adhesin PilV [Erwinia tracheiphila]